MPPNSRSLPAETKRLGDPPTSVVGHAAYSPTRPPSWYPSDPDRTTTKGEGAIRALKMLRKVSFPTTSPTLIAGVRTSRPQGRWIALATLPGDGRNSGWARLSTFELEPGMDVELELSPAAVVEGSLRTPDGNAAIDEQSVTLGAELKRHHHTDPGRSVPPRAGGQPPDPSFGALAVLRPRVSGRNRSRRLPPRGAGAYKPLARARP